MISPFLLVEEVAGSGNCGQPDWSGADGYGVRLVNGSSAESVGGARPSRYMSDSPRRAGRRPTVGRDAPVDNGLANGTLSTSSLLAGFNTRPGSGAAFESKLPSRRTLRPTERNTRAVYQRATKADVAFTEHSGKDS
jgi:hypothetical protein